MISLVSASTATPENKFSTTELVASMMHKLSPELINTICSLGVENRYSAMDNYADFLTGAPMNPTSSTTELGVNATRKCIEEWGGEQSQGCSVMLKSVEVAQWYLAANPGKLAVVLMAEAHTPYVAPLMNEEYFGFREIARMRKNGIIDDAAFDEQRTDTTLAIQSMLFGDGAVALLLGTDQPGKPAFGPISHLTNDNPDDVNLLSMVSSSTHPSLSGKPQYFMRPAVPNRGAHYAVTTVNDVLDNPMSPV